ncbi:MAG: hypothetical protein AAF700_03475 [Pseudomonadota bacterium]
MQKILIPVALGALGALAACGVPPEEEATSQSAYKPLHRSLIVPVDAATLDQSQAWAELVKSYE